MEASDPGTAALEGRVVRAAEAALAADRFVSPVEVLLRLGWLPQARLEQWRQGRLRFLEQELTVGRGKVAAALRILAGWAEARALVPHEVAYVARTRDRADLAFTETRDSVLERAYRTHWVSPDLPPARRELLAQRQGRPPELVVISPLGDWTCTACGGTGDLLLMEEGGPLCRACADLDHLVFLPAGDAALTRRAKRASRLAAVVVRFSRTRRRYERQGVLVEESALEQAELACLADAEARARRREREAERRLGQDEELRDRFAREIGRLFPGCPAGRADAIARHAVARGSGRVGRSALGRAADAAAVELAVVASIRHEDTDYDELLMQGIQRADARERVREDVDRILDRWRGSTTATRRSRAS